MQDAIKVKSQIKFLKYTTAQDMYVIAVFQANQVEVSLSRNSCNFYQQEHTGQGIRRGVSDWC